MTKDEKVDVDQMARSLVVMPVHEATLALAARVVELLGRVEGLEARNEKLYETLRMAEDYGVDEGLFDEEERMTERLPTQPKDTPPNAHTTILRKTERQDGYN